MAFFLLPTPLAFAICPAISYLISRRFRRRQRTWGAFQALQAAVVQLIILAMVFLTVAAGLPPRLELTIGTVGFLLFLYSLWGAVDTLMGYDFRYIFIGDLVDKVRIGRSLDPRFGFLHDRNLAHALKRSRKHNQTPDRFDR